MTGTALAAIAAIGGLWAQAVATYWSQQTAKDQLAQSREDGNRELRAQASRVTFWIAATEDGPRPHIANRSQDAVTAVYIWHEGMVLALPDLAPCTEIVYMPESDRSKDGILVKPPEILTNWSLYTDTSIVGFTDRAGQHWRRKTTALNQTSTFDPYTTHQLQAVPATSLHTKSAQQCSSNPT
ncbi:hypothetical protein ACFYNL_06085 [Streptomyces sp. NPDC007808]|uniref:hypothetical protein n=1 Tax=Streptomyces sp. NPDC007808 TaxID=3364779 RepID=UPI0036CFF354